VSFLSKTEMEHCVPLCREDSHDMGVSFFSEMEMEHCVSLCREDSHEMDASFEMKQCVSL
jgi:hypothetical protein